MSLINATRRLVVRAIVRDWSRWPLTVMALMLALGFQAWQLRSSRQENSELCRQLQAIYSAPQPFRATYYENADGGFIDLYRLDGVTRWHFQDEIPVEEYVQPVGGNEIYFRPPAVEHTPVRGKNPPPPPPVAPDRTSI